MAKDVQSTQWDVDVFDRGVRAWSQVGLGFEPRGEMLEYRTVLRRALRNLEAVTGRALIVTYGCPNDRFVDVENAALYNIGASAYSHLIDRSLYCRRTESLDGRHHLSYTLGELPELTPGPVLASLTVKSPMRAAKPGQWWKAFREAALLHPEPARYCGVFAIDLIVPATWSSVSLANVVKPLLDGLISALHTHDLSAPEILNPRIGAFGDPLEVWQLLHDPAFDLLGSRRLVRKHGEGLAWNPADDRLQIFRVHKASEAGLVRAEIRALPDV